MCWRTYFLRRMESQAKGTHYNICACARKETTEGWKKTRRYGRVLYDTRVLTCSTSGSRHVWHPGLGMHDTRVSVTRKRLTGLTAQEENNTETCNAKERQKERRQRKGYKKNNDTVKEQKTQKKGERRLTAWKTRSKSQPDKPVKGRRTLY